MGDTQEINDKGFFKKLSDGDFGLAKTYWLYGILVSIGAQIVMAVVEMSESVALIIIISLVMFGYFVFQIIGVWNASNRYTGSKIWAVLAKISAVLSVLGLILGLGVLLMLANI
jgi:hypothetical protein